MNKLVWVFLGVISCSVAFAQDKPSQNQIAISEATQKLKNNPRDFDARRARADAMLAERKYPNAIADYNLLLNKAQSPVLYYKRGEAYLNWGGSNENAGGELQKAIENFTQALDIDNRNTYSYYLRGEAHRKLGQYNEAIADINRALGIQDNNIFFYWSRGEANFELGNYQKAIDDWKLSQDYGYDDKTLDLRIAAAREKMK